MSINSQTLFQRQGHFVWFVQCCGHCIKAKYWVARAYKRKSHYRLKLSIASWSKVKLTTNTGSARLN
ncbi:MAG: hypothetical protein WA177_13300, partial [Xanthobacteraceae bacterium]